MRKKKLIEMIENLAAACKNMLYRHKHHMPAPDVRSRARLVEKAWKKIDQYRESKK